MKTKVNMTPEKRRNTILSLLLIVAILGEIGRAHV